MKVKAKIIKAEDGLYEVHATDNTKKWCYTLEQAKQLKNKLENVKIKS